MNIAVIIAAAGASRRYTDSGGLRSKLDEDLGGKPVLQRSVELFSKHDDVKFIVVAGPGDDADFSEFKSRHSDRLGLLGAVIVKGGKDHRWQTVKAALEAIPAHSGDDAITHVAVHDAARPAAPAELIDRVFELARHHPAVVPGLEVGDTLKRVSKSDAPARPSDPLAAILGAAATEEKTIVVESTIDRAGLFAVQTPQTFEIGVLRSAYAQADLSSTDDASLVEKLFASEGKGRRVVVAPGDARNIKITRAGDLSLARAVMGLRGPEERPVHKRF
ncbi:MAG: 2-C-methyl-D-erythritol 4-phosphate cytidylyltransferase [Phycisphaeraceae bacterium]|nr:2-C-methyl-D-erythritol 4-phosphate cytidylyltransferase [Phycisphaeraceae bacterium]